MNVMVTGGAGYIGSVTAASLIDAGHRVVVVDDLSKGHRVLVPPDAAFVQAAVGDPDLLSKTGDIDACVHFAASIEVGESIQVPELYFVNNTSQTTLLLKTLVDAGVRRFVFSSTAAVYGDPGRVPIQEDDPMQPTNVYGESKLLVERALSWLSKLRGLRYASLRYFNASGATPERGEMHDPETHIVPLLLQAALGRRDHVKIFGDDYPTPDGTCVRDYIHIADLADAHVRALDALDEHEALTCNLGNGRGFTVKEVVESCRRVSGRDFRVEVAPRRAGDPPQLVASAERAKTFLGWEPKVPDLDDIVASAWEWHRSR
jgi:UDP-glucose 4-epimerase